MTKFGSLIRYIFPHRTWPYPRGEREVRQVIIVSLAIVLLTLAGIIAGLKYQDEKTLRSSDLYFVAKDMTSYSNEAYLIATSSQNGPLVSPYRQVYIKQLESNVSAVKDKLTTHTTDRNLQSRTAKLQNICDQVNTTLDAFSRQPSDQLLATQAAKLHHLAAEAKTIEGSL